MESWDKLILQWINCLLNSTDDCVQSTEELQDGKKYLTLISKLKRFKHKIDDDQDTERDMVIQFLKDEYPNFVFGTKTQTTENLCIALLVLSRLSLEPIFHKSLCTNLNLDIQIRIKSVLESLYSLGKKVTIEDLCSAFSLLDKSGTESFPTKPKYLLEAFLNSPVTRSVHSDSKIHEQTRQIRHLQADLETMRYEKSELIEDIKIQKKQIDDLHQKLQETLLELKHLRQDSLKSNDFNGSYEPTTPKSLESSYEKELQSLENYVAELQSDNFKLQDEKTKLLDELKIYQSKYISIEEKSLKHEEMIESLLLQIERKDNELIELKIKYEELCAYLKEKSKPFFMNQSFDLDDRGIAENSMNNSETLSSVIEIQLQDAKKEIIEAQNKYKIINSLLTIIMEEYVKLKKMVQILLNDNAKIKAEYEEKYRIINDQLQDILDKEKLDKGSQSENDNELDLSHVKDNITRILEGDSKEMKSLLLKFLNQLNVSEEIKKSNNHIDFTPDNGSSDDMDLEYLNTLRSLQKYQGDKSINVIDKNRLVFKFYDIIWQENWRKNLVIFFKTLLQNNNVFGNVTDKISNHEQIIVKYRKIDTMLEKNLIKCLQDLYYKNEAEKVSLITKDDLETIRSDWILLYNDIKDNLKLYKVMLLLEQKWDIVSESFRNENYLIDDMREVLRKKDAIDSEFSKMFFMNSQILSFKYIAATQFTSKINKSENDKLHIEDVNDSILENNNTVDLITQSDCIQKIVNIIKSIDEFSNMKKSIESKPKIKIEWANISMQTDLVAIESTVETEYANISIQTELVETEPTVETKYANISIQTELIETESTVETEYANISIQTELMETEPTIETEYANISTQTENQEKVAEVEPVVKIDCANVSLQTDSFNDSLEIDVEIKTEYVNVSLQTDDPTEFLETTPVIKTEYANISLQTDIEPIVQTEYVNICLQTDTEPSIKTECTDVSLQTEDVLDFVKTEPVERIKSVDVSLQTENVIEVKTEPAEKIECANVSLQTDNPTEVANVSLQTSIVEPIETHKAVKVESALESEEVQQYVKELHEKYELKLEKMKDKMKTVFNSQMSAIKKEQESGSMTKKLKALEEKLEHQCHNHSEELKKYKKHVSELSTQLWEVGDKLLIEKQKKEEIIHKYKDLKTKLDILEAHNSKASKLESKSHEHQFTKAEVERQPLQQLEVTSVSKMQNVRNFQVMGNAFRTEDEEGELFDTTYNLSELQRSQNIPPVNDLDRLSILQMRNAKCKPHLKSAYAAEMQSYPLPVTEDEIKTGSASEEVFNDSLSQSLLTGKKVKRRDRTRNGSETPRRSTRRFSNIFRKPRLSLDRK